METLTLECDRSRKDLLIAELHEAGTLGVIEDELPDGRCRLQAFFERDAGVAELSSRFSSYQAICGQTAPVDWVGMARAAWEPLSIGERLFLVPSWRPDATPPGRLRLEMPPGTASGTGLHTSTQLALEAVERSILAGDRFLDLGTGSGILSAAACLMGAGTVVACDIDGEAVREARRYLYACQAGALFYTGSSGGLRHGWFDVAAANIHAQALAWLVADIARILKPGGRAILGGFTDDQVPLLDPLLAAAGLQVRERLSRVEWICLIAIAGS